MVTLDSRWMDVSWVAFDTETTGKYPLGSEICEIAAVKWRGGEIVDEFQTLIKPRHPMGQEVINIHHITNEMVEHAPTIGDKIGEFVDFIKNSALVAHHAPFDLGFLAAAIELEGLRLPEGPVFCSSLLSRKMIPESGNHRLQTLIRFLKLPQGQAHRALDDARACWSVAEHSMRRIGEGATLSEVESKQMSSIRWRRFSIADVRATPVGEALVSAIVDQELVQIAYEGGSRPGQMRTVRPIGLVRSLEQDFLVAIEEGETQSKRYFMDKVSRANR